VNRTASSDTRSIRATGYLRPTWQEAIAEYLPRSWRGERCVRWIDRLPLATVLAVYVAMCARLDNTAFIDEARAISAGRSVLQGTAGDLGFTPPGVPELYPVAAAALDAVGGLHLARLLSCVSIGVAIVALASSVVRATSSKITGLLAACAFAATAPVVFVGALATPDAVCLALLAVAASTAMAARSLATAAVTGLLLAAAVAVAFVAALFVPVVLLAILFARTGGSARSPEPPQARLGIALAVAIGSFAALQLLAGDEVRRGLAVTFGSLGAPGTGALWGAAVLDIGLLVVPAVAGTIVAVRTATRTAARRAAACGLLLAGLALPLVHLLTGGAMSFDQHNAYAALLLAPMAGYGLTVLSRQMFRVIPVLVALLLALVPVFSRSEALFHQWSDVGVVMADIEAHPQPGPYLSVASDAFAYHARAVPDVRWEATSALYARGPTAVRRAVAERRYQVIVLRTASTAGPDQDVLLRALTRSADYERDPLAQPTDHVRDEWLVYRLVNTLP
jgi:hypothetical protein